MRLAIRTGCALAASLLSSSIADAQNLVHLWAFDEPIGFRQDFADTSGNGQNGSGAGDIISGRWGNAVSLLPGSNPETGGIGDGVDFVDATPENSPLPTAATDSWSLSFWANLTNAPGDLEYMAGFGIDDEENNDNQQRARSAIHFNGDRGYHFWGASVDLSTNLPVPGDSQWHMYTVTYDGASTELNMYYDGVRAASTVFGGSGPFRDAPAEVHVGNPSNWNEEFDGAIDEFGIWDGVLAPEQVGGLFLSNDTAQTQFLEPNAVVDRATGEISLSNLTTAAIGDVVGYRVTSAAGALDPAGWTTITGNLDNGGGSQPVDNGPWAVGVESEYELSENDQGGAAGTLAAGLKINLGEVWKKSTFEDIGVELLIDNGGGQSTLDVLVSYAGDALGRSDLNADGVIDVQDWAVFSANGFTSLAGLSEVEAYLHGDLDGDGDNDRIDYRLFKADYIAANGAAAFAALTAVPEPTAALLVVSGALAVVAPRRRW